MALLPLYIFYSSLLGTKMCIKMFHFLNPTAQQGQQSVPMHVESTDMRLQQQETVWNPLKSLCNTICSGTSRRSPSQNSLIAGTSVKNGTPSLLQTSE